MDEIFTKNEIENGLSEEKIISLCNSKNLKSGGFPWIYWTSEAYSFGKYLRKYAYYPSFFPLTVYSDHSGPNLSDEPYKHELECDAPIFLTHSKEKSKNYIKKTGKKSCVIKSPSVYCRITNKLEQANNARGTIAFPVHTLPNYTEIFDAKKYIKDLKNLPKEFHPIAVCMHMHDVNKGRHKLFIEENIPVFTAGNNSDQRFSERLYSILKEFKYSTSNNLGTITFLSIEMNIPFFIYGTNQIEINHSDENIPIGKSNIIKNKTVDVLNKKLKYEVFNKDIDPKVKIIVEKKIRA